MVENPVAFLGDEFIPKDSLGVGYAMFSGAGAVTAPAARRTILNAMREVEQDLGLSPFYGIAKLTSLDTKTSQANRDLLMALRPQTLTEDEAAEFESFRDTPSAAAGMKFARVPREG